MEVVGLGNIGIGSGLLGSGSSVGGQELGIGGLELVVLGLQKFLLVCSGIPGAVVPLGRLGVPERDGWGCLGYWTTVTLPLGEPALAATPRSAIAKRSTIGTHALDARPWAIARGHCPAASGVMVVKTSE